MDFKNTVIILNGPPNSGKDTIADAMAAEFGLQNSRFKAHLYAVTAVVFNLDLDSFIIQANDREAKESRTLLLNGVLYSPREALIYVSEKVIKPHFGDDYFGQMFAENLDLVRGTVASDGGFESEVYPVIEQVGAENVFIIQFTRYGADSFEGDSRDWVNVEGVETLRTTNNGTVQEIVNNIYDYIMSVRNSRCMS